MNAEVNGVYEEFEAFYNELSLLNHRYLPNEVLAKCYLIRIRNSINSTYHLLNLGFIHESYILLRSIAETTILFTACLQDKKFIKTWHKLMLYIRIVNVNKTLLEKINQGSTDSNKELIENELKKAKRRKKCYEKITNCNSSEIKALADLWDSKYEYYDIMAVCNSTVHALSHTMQHFIKVDHKTKNVIFSENPRSDGDKIVLNGLFYCYYKVLNFYCQHFNLNQEVKLSRLSQLIVEKINVLS